MSRSRTPFAVDALDLSFAPGPSGTGARCVYLQDDRVLVDRTGHSVLHAVPPHADARVVPIGRLDGAAVSAVVLGSGDQAPAPLEPVGPRDLFGLVGDDELGCATRASQLAEFDRDHQFCGRCGRPAEPSAVEHARVCTGCGATVYPRL